MWSWLEQLKDPIISSEDIKTLSENNVHPQNAIYLLGKVSSVAAQVRFYAEISAELVRVDTHVHMILDRNIRN